MKHIPRVVAITAFAAILTLEVQAEGFSFNWVGGTSTDWTLPENYEAQSETSATIPGSGDVVSIPADVTAKLLASDSASVAVVSGLSRIALSATTSHVEVFVDSTDSETTLECGINHWTGYVSNSRDYGGLIKTGAGTLILTKTGRNLYTTIDVREGTVKLASNANTYFIENIVLADDTTFYANPGGYTSTGRMSGTGTITNTVSQVFQIDEADRVTVFDGTVGSRIYLYAGGNVTLNGTASTMNNFSVRDNNGEGATGPRAEIKSFGMANVPSSIGGYLNVFLTGNGAYLRYGGSGETTDKTLYVNGNSEYPYYIDGGATGGLAINGGIAFSSDSDFEFHLTGSNRNACVMAGPIVLSGGDSDVHVKLVKDGSGTWRLSDNAYRKNSDAIEVRDGTLQFDTLAECESMCSLGIGKSTLLYNLILGGANGERGMLEYTGSKPAKCLTRTIGLESVGGFKSDSASLRFSGVMDATEGDKTLVLDGAAGSANELQNVRQASGTISILKEGAGKWSLSGACEASGKVQIKAGTLVARDPKLYRWYRFNIKKLYNKEKGAEVSADGNFMIWVFGLYDADGNWITASYPQHGSDYALGDGAAGFVSSRFEGEWQYSTKTYGCLTNAFVDSVSLDSRCAGRFKDADGNVLEPDPDDEDTWGRIVIRVADDAPPITSFDFVQSGYYCWASPRNIITWSLDASVDGINWEEVSATEEARSLWTSSGNGVYTYFWYYGREKYEEGQAVSHSMGKQIATHSTSSELSTPLASIQSISIAAGATFKSAGVARPVSTLAVDMAGMGTLDGVSFADDGTLAVTGAGRVTAPLTLPGTYANTTGIDKLSGWNLTIDGVKKDSLKIDVDTDGASPVIRLVPPPTILLLK